MHNNYRHPIIKLILDRIPHALTSIIIIMYHNFKCYKLPIITNLQCTIITHILLVISCLFFSPGFSTVYRVE